MLGAAAATCNPVAPGATGGAAGRRPSTLVSRGGIFYQAAQIAMGKDVLEDTVTVHVGLHKTASTLIQRALETDAPTLTRRLSLVTRKINNVRALPWFSDLGRKGRSVERISAADKAAIEKALRGQGVDPDGALLISNEDFLGSFRLERPGRAYPATADFAQSMVTLFGDRLRFVVYFRNPVTYFMASFVQHIQSGDLVDFEDYRAEFTPQKLDWNGILGDLVAAVGRDRVQCVLYDEINQAIAPYCANVLTFHDGLSFSRSTDAIFETKVNKGLSDRGLKAAMGAYPFLTAPERRDLKRFLQKSLVDDDKPYFPLSEAEIRTFLDDGAPALCDFGTALAPERRRIVESWLDIEYYGRYLA